MRRVEKHILPLRMSDETPDTIQMYCFTHPDFVRGAYFALNLIATTHSGPWKQHD